MSSRSGGKRPKTVTAISIMAIVSGALNILISLVKFIPLLMVGAPAAVVFFFVGYGALPGRPEIGIGLIFLSFVITIIFLISSIFPLIWAVIEIKKGVSILGERPKERTSFWFGVAQAVVGSLNFNLISLAIGLVNTALLCQTDVKAYLNNPGKKREKKKKGK